ncbi:MlaE family lipid ABC transporter permease subunit [candidate division KSB1 bacterium]|nr:MlaE family lipid ABC transporter permease subunit [candidate division KSB1 bacterium]
MIIDVSENSLTFEGDLDLDAVGEHYKQLMDWLAKNREKNIYLDLAHLNYLDSAGVALLDELYDKAQKQGTRLHFVAAPNNIQATISAFSSRHIQKPEPKPVFPLFERVGQWAYQIWLEFVYLIYLVSDAFYFTVIQLVSRKGVRKGEFSNQCILIGMDAFPIVALISFLIGFILALQSAAQLRQFGASIYVADLVAISMTREMGPIMTAIIFAGRSGSSIAAEIATMVVTEETDALKSMGLNPIRYNLVPKIHAISMMMPLLTVLSMLLGILGSMVIGITYLDIGVKPFYNQVVNALILKDIVTGIIKSVVFAWLIVLTAAAYGFRTRGGAADVGRATTASVVTSIFLVILADSLLGLIFYFDPTSPI